MAACTFTPAVSEKPNDLSHIDNISVDAEYKMVFAGKTYDFATEGDLK